MRPKATNVSMRRRGVKIERGEPPARGLRGRGGDGDRERIMISCARVPCFTAQRKDERMSWHAVMSEGRRQ